MSHVLVAISGTNEPLSQSLFGEVIAASPAAHRSRPNWLADNEACECNVFTWDGNGGAKNWTSEDEMVRFVRGEVVEPALAKWPLDIAFLPTKNRRKKLLVADMESTIIEQELVDELAGRIGIGEEIAAITEKAMRGDLNFSEALAARIVKFKGVDSKVLNELYDAVATFMPGAGTLVATMNTFGARTALVSGGFTVFTERVATKLGFHEHRGNNLEIADGTLTGQIMPPILGRKAKAAALTEIATANGIDRDLTLAVGDGANDLDMIAQAGLGVAFRAKPIVNSHAKVSIRHGDLTALLFLQGYGKAQFVTT